MTTGWARGRRGASAADLVVLLAAVSLVAALLYPGVRARSFRALVAQATADVDALSAAARGVRENTMRWPTSAAPGAAPPEMSSLGAEDGRLDRDRYTLQWASLEVVDSVEAPPPSDLPSADDAPGESAAPTMLPVVRSVGAVMVHSSDRALLAELSGHYPDDSSFVLDTLWVLVLPERAEPAPRS